MQNLKIKGPSENPDTEEKNNEGSTHREVRCKGEGWIQLAQDMLLWQTIWKQDNEPSDSKMGRGIS